MAIKLNKENLTPEQIQIAEPLIRTIEKYERDIAREKMGIDPINDPFEKAKKRKDRIAAIETKKRAVGKELETHLNARNEFDELVEEAIALIHEIGKRSKKYGFSLNEKQKEALK